MKKVFLCSAIIASVMFSACQKEEVIVPQDKEVQVESSKLKSTQSGWVMQSWNFSLFKLSNVFQVGSKGLVVVATNNSSSSLIVYVQQRDAVNHLLVEDQFPVAPYGTGNFSTSTPEPGVSNVLVTIVKGAGGSFIPKGIVSLNSKY